MRAGSIDQPITFRRETETADGTGGFTVTWTEIGQDWAEVMPRGGRESEGSDRVEAVDGAVFRVRYRTDLKPSDIIDWGGVYYNIRVLPSVPDRAMFMDVQAERGVAP